MMDSVFAVMRLGLSADFSRLSTYSQNLANVDTVGYKRQIPLTSEFEARVDSLDSTQYANVLDSVVTDVRPGTLKSTGRSLDLALDGDGFFVVQGKSGVQYTRRGDFSVDGSGRLVTASGDAVLGNGSEILVPNTSVTIDRQGNIYDGSRQIAHLDIAHFQNPQRLQYVGNGEFEADGQTPDESRSATQVRSGFLEASNVQPAHEMIGLMKISHEVELNRNVLTARDDMLDSIATLAQF